jgi:hypothetical protein
MDTGFESLVGNRFSSRRGLMIIGVVFVDEERIHPGRSFRSHEPDWRMAIKKQAICLPF